MESKELDSIASIVSAHPLVQSVESFKKPFDRWNMPLRNPKNLYTDMIDNEYILAVSKNPKKSIAGMNVLLALIFAELTDHELHESYEIQNFIYTACPLPSVDMGYIKFKKDFTEKGFSCATLTYIIPFPNTPAAQRFKDRPEFHVNSGVFFQR